MPLKQQKYFGSKIERKEREFYLYLSNYGINECVYVYCAHIITTSLLLFSLNTSFLRLLLLLYAFAWLYFLSNELLLCFKLLEKSILCAQRKKWPKTIDHDDQFAGCV